VRRAPYVDWVQYREVAATIGGRLLLACFINNFVDDVEEEEEEEEGEGEEKGEEEGQEEQDKEQVHAHIVPLHTLTRTRRPLSPARIRRARRRHRRRQKGRTRCPLRTVAGR
jgi:hypothetical protein